MASLVAGEMDGHAKDILHEEWQKVRDEDGNVYWWNTNTDETCWTLPAGVRGPPILNVTTTALAGPGVNATVPPATLQKQQDKLSKKQRSKMRKQSKVGKAATSAPTSSTDVESTAATPAGSSSAIAAAPKTKRTGLSLFGHSRGDSKGKAASMELNDKLRQMRKEKGQDVELQDVVDSLEIGSPYEVEHKMRVRFDEDQVRYSGLPPEWSSEANKQFGVPLTKCPRMEIDGYAERIPAVLVMLRKRLEELDGYHTEGIFRLAPHGEESSRVKAGIDAGMGAQYLKECDDPHVMANLIKVFLRELQPNLLNTLGRDKIIELAALKGEACAQAIEAIEEPNRSVVQWLLDTLTLVAQNTETNLMSAQACAIVTAPNLFDAGPNVAPMEALVLSQKCAVLFTNLLRWKAQIAS